MKRFWILACALGAAACCQTPQQGAPMRPTEHVTTLMGTQSDYALSTGNTYPAVALPWGMNFWTPQTGRMGDGWTYTYGAHTLRGLKQTHQPSPWINDYGQFAVMPVRGDDKLDEESRQSWFSHQSEVAKPYYYSVYLADHDIVAEVTPTERAAMMRFTFPESRESGVVIDAFDRGSRVEMVDDRTVAGYTTRNSGGVPDNFRNWFVIRFDKPFDAIELTDSPSSYRAGSRPLYPEGGKSVEGEHAVAKVHFATERGEQVTARIASSFISAEQALRNLETELGADDFETVKSKAQARWDEVLGRIEVAGGSVDQLRTFYSCLYRSVLFPRKFYEIDAAGKPIHYSPYNGEVRPGYMYTDTGFWDTFRCLFPLLNLVYPSVNAEIQAGLANTWRESGFLPEWASPGHRGCMVGNNSASVVSDAILKGVTPAEDVGELYEAMMSGRTKVHPEISSTGRLGHEYYNTLGYVPCNVGINENVARTLEYAYDDWCIAQVAEKLGKTEDAAMLEKAAQNYRNVFDAGTKLMRGRNADGTFQTPFSPYKWGDAYTEGNAWHYTWSVFHDVGGLAELMGGKEEFSKMLDSVFVVPPVYDDSYYGVRIHEITEMQVANMGNYAHGNQPAQHMIYLYDYAGEPHKAQYWVREVMDRLYKAQPDGYCGDEDNGQTSAWYVFSALGFYPVCPGADEYAVGAPLFRRATIHLENGAKIEIEAPENSPANRYVGKMSVDGKPLAEPFLRYSELKEGATLRFDMQAEPAVK
ncbi:GH92 family glycosyl hydrolase [Alistipes sp. An66]|uniref:GH92 family glycosyl hydrolase n=1 Tax=Alistipes sp. An66 TaxID=1965650 RepID=UPI000B380B46|nr:GH92 family glycosyl hydrolase [Alistipes sp. An66]OUN58790.1 alpha-mannosidase [Alistipes sp. An66]